MILTSVTSYLAMSDTGAHSPMFDSEHFAEAVCHSCFKHLNEFRTKKKSLSIAASEVFPSGRIYGSPLLQNAKCIGCWLTQRWASDSSQEALLAPWEAPFVPEQGFHSELAHWGWGSEGVHVGRKGRVQDDPAASTSLTHPALKTRVS